MKIKTIEFLVKNITSYIEDEVCIVAFADSTNEQPEKYVILSQTLFDKDEQNDDIGVEFKNDSADEGEMFAPVKRMQITEHCILIELLGEKEQILKIELQLEAPLPLATIEHLKMIFSNLQLG